jgi:hypothetical protein
MFHVSRLVKKFTSHDKKSLPLVDVAVSLFREFLTFFSFYFKKILKKGETKILHDERETLVRTVRELCSSSASL